MMSKELISRILDDIGLEALTDFNPDKKSLPYGKINKINEKNDRGLSVRKKNFDAVKEPHKANV